MKTSDKKYFAIIYLILALMITIRCFGATYIQGPGLIQGIQSITASGGTTVLTKNSQTNQIVSGTGVQTLQLPDPSTIPIGRFFEIANRTDSDLTVNYTDGSLAKTLVSGSQSTMTLVDALSLVGNWDASNVVTLPIQYLLNGTKTTVSQDTGTPANSNPLPIQYLNNLGVETNLSTDASLLAMSAKLPATLGQKTAANSLAVILASDQTFPLPSGAATETTLSAINVKTPALGQTTMSASSPVAIASDQSALQTTYTSLTSTVNSTSSNLGISAVFTGTSENVKNYASIEVFVFADQASAASGLSMQQSTNGTNWDNTDTYTIPASTGKTFSLAPAATFFRLVYTNGVVATTNLRIQVTYHLTLTRSSTHSLADPMTLQNDAELVISQLRATNGTNAVPLIADASGNLAINNAMVNGIAIVTGNGVTGTGSQRVTIASDNTAFNVLSQTTTPTAKTVKQANITVGTTAVRATTDAAVPTAGRVWLSFRLDPSSTALCYYGSSSVTSSSTTRGILVFPGESIDRPFDAGDYYLICDTAAQTFQVVEQE